MTVLSVYSLYDIFLSKLAFNSAIFWAKYASGSIKLMKPGPAISILVPVSSGSFSGAVFENSLIKTSAISRGFLCKRPASFMATLVAKSARKSPVCSSSGAGVTSTEKWLGVSKRCSIISDRIDSMISIYFLACFLRRSRMSFKRAVWSSCSDLASSSFWSSFFLARRSARSRILFKALTMRKMTKAMIRKLTTAWRKLP